jgi:hypothetical protein
MKDQLREDYVMEREREKGKEKRWWDDEKVTPR